MKTFACLFIFFPLVPAASAQKARDPVLVSAQLPKYPVLPRTARVEGDVKAEFTLDRGGDVTSVKIISGHALLKEATEDNIRTWKFQLSPREAVDGKVFRTKFSYKLSGRYVGESKVPRLTVTFDSFDNVEITSDQGVAVIQD
jgi:TonB family protein